MKISRCRKISMHACGSLSTVVQHGGQPIFIRVRELRHFVKLSTTIKPTITEHVVAFKAVKFYQEEIYHGCIKYTFQKTIRSS